jgi:hypothetical protein
MRFWDFFRFDDGPDDDLLVNHFDQVEQMMLELSGQRRRLFGSDCVERILPIFERQFPDDERPRSALMVARRLAFGIAFAPELAAARDAVMQAAQDVAARAPPAFQDSTKLVWPPLAIVGAAAVVAAPNLSEVDPIAVSRYALSAVEGVSGHILKERQWQYERLQHYLGGKSAT